MSLLPSKSDTIKDIEDQIKVLATNLEVLNQKLIADPNAAISPGEAILKKQLSDTIVKLEHLEEFMRGHQEELAKKLLVNAQLMGDSFQKIQKSLSTIPEERHALREEIKRLNELTNNLSTLDKKWLSSLLTRMEILNQNAYVLNENINTFYSKLVDDIARKVSGISEEASAKIFKNMMWFIIGMIFLSVLFTILSSYIVGKFFIPS